MLMDTIPARLKAAAYIPAKLFGAVVSARNSLYSKGLLPFRRLPAPVISIGNITMGGSGKTPLTIHTARALVRLGLKPAVLTRGYGRDNPNQILVLLNGENKTPAEIGDEPALIQRCVPSIMMGIAKNRFEAGAAICSKCPDAVFILDDGFQHRKLFRDLNIVIISRSQPFASNSIFPLGTLREPLASLQRADVILINGSFSADADPIEELARRINPNAIFFKCRQKISSLIPFPSWDEMKDAGAAPEALSKSSFLMSAIGSPERFERDILESGIRVKGKCFFRDHHRLTQNDWINCIQKAKSVNAEVIIITEKDAVKIYENPGFPVMVAVQSTELSDESGFEQLLKTRVKERQCAKLI